MHLRRWMPLLLCVALPLDRPLFAQTAYTPQPPALSESASANGHNYILNTEVLRTNEVLVSNNKEFVIVMQPDGNLCEYFGSSLATIKPGALWCSNAVGATGRWSLVFGTDGNMCVCPGEERGPGAIWCNNKLSNGSSFAMLNDGGTFFTQTGTPQQPGVTFWDTGLAFSYVFAAAPANGAITWPDNATCPPACSKILKVNSTVDIRATPAANYAFNAWDGSCKDKPNPCSLTVATGGTQNISVAFRQASPSANGGAAMLSGQVLRAGEYITSANRQYYLTMQDDGNLCEYAGSSPATKQRWVWCTQTQGRSTLILGGDGNLCVTSGDDYGQGPNRWCTNKTAAGTASAFVAIADDGNLVTYAGTPQQAGAALWRNAVAGDIYSTLSAPAGSIGIEMGGTITQRFQSNITAYPTSLTLAAGDLYRPETFDLAVFVDGARILSRRFYGVVAGRDGMIVLPIKQVDRQVMQGSSVQFQMTFYRRDGLGLAAVSDPNCAAVRVTPLVDVPQPARFSFRGSAQPDYSAYTDAPNPNVFRDNTYESGGMSAEIHGLAAGQNFSQTFTALATGVPTQLGIIMGHFDIPWSANLKIAVNGKPAYDHDYTGLLETPSNEYAWVKGLAHHATPFALPGNLWINAGDTVTFTVTPKDGIEFEIGRGPVEVGIPTSALSGPCCYNDVFAMFYMRK